MSAHLKGAAIVLMVVLGGVLKLTDPPAEDNRGEKERSQLRDAMLMQIRRYGMTNSVVLTAMGKVRRDMFIPEKYRSVRPPYGDHPCPIGHGQTISQPFIVAHMTAHLPITNGTRVLEIGTGSGYQAAVLAEMGADVYSIEIIPELAEHAKQALKSEGYNQVKVLTGDGYKGWPKHAPFDAIIVTCAPANIPEALVTQLSENGTMILPVGTAGNQRLIIMKKKDGKVRQEANIRVLFVPMVKKP